MTTTDYEKLLDELKWLKVDHPEKTQLITFIEKFKKYVITNRRNEPKCAQNSTSVLMSQ
jgi:hypothetical protein